MVLAANEEPPAEFKHGHRLAHVAEAEPLLSPSVTGESERGSVPKLFCPSTQHPATLPLSWFPNASPVTEGLNAGGWGLGRPRLSLTSGNLHGTGKASGSGCVPEYHGSGWCLRTGVDGAAGHRCHQTQPKAGAPCSRSALNRCRRRVPWRSVEVGFFCSVLLLPPSSACLGFHSTNSI